MTNDALDPGRGGTYPYWPRKADGSPDPERMPSGLTRQPVKGKRPVLIDVTQYDANGDPIVPPELPPGGPHV